MHELVIIVAQYFIAIPVLATIALLVSVALKDKRQSYVFLARLILGGILALAIAWIARKLYNDPRPFVVGHFKPYFSHAADNGFISDHTLAASFLAFSCYFYRKWIGLALLAVAILIGWARVIAGVHHWTDIVSAIIVSLFAAVIAWAIFRPSIFEHKNGKNQLKNT